MTDIAALERRVQALEAGQHDTTETLRWVVAKLGRVSAVQEEHGLRLERIEADVREVKADLKGLRRDLPSIIAETMREVLREHKANTI
jgi:ribosome assembly protein YihI (activator of Der GTPase)